MLTLGLAIAGAALGALSVFLHVVAPKTKTTKDDWLRDKIDALQSAVDKLK